MAILYCDRCKYNKEISFHLIPVIYYDKYVCPECKNPYLSKKDIIIYHTLSILELIGLIKIDTKNGIRLDTGKF